MFHVSVSVVNQWGEWRSVVRLKFVCLNLGLGRFSSIISRFKCGLCGKTLKAQNL